MATKKNDSFLEKRLMLASVVFWVLTAVTFVYLYRPQCPEYYSQTQVDMSSCVVGANIGATLATLFLMPYFLVLCVFWGKKILRTLSHPQPRKK